MENNTQIIDNDTTQINDNDTTQIIDYAEMRVRGMNYGSLYIGCPCQENYIPLPIEYGINNVSAECILSRLENSCSCYELFYPKNNDGTLNDPNIDSKKTKMIKKYCKPFSKRRANIRFLTEDGDLVGSDGIRTNFYTNDKYVLVITGGIIDGEYHRIRYIPEFSYFMTVSTKIKCIPIENVYFSEYISSISDTIYEIKLTPFKEHYFYTCFKRKLYLLKNFSENQIIPTEFLKIARDYFINIDDKRVVIKCKNGSVMVPTYLRKFFGDDTPIFRNTKQKNKNVRAKKHNICAITFRRIIKWMKKLLVHNQFPLGSELVFNGKIDINKIIYICEYTKISYEFTNFFRKIAIIIENNYLIILL